jgi:uncharacterized protein (TIRG00374 family)
LVVPKKQLRPEQMDVGRSKIPDEVLLARDESLWVTRSIIVLITLAAIYAAATLWAAHNAWPVTLGAVSWGDILIVIGLVSVALLIRAARWHYYLHVLDWRIPLRPSLLAFIASIALTATPGKAGELIKFVLLRSRFRISLTEGSGILLIERLGDLVAIMVLAAGGLTLFVDLRSYFVISLLLVSTAALFISSPTLRGVLLLRITRIPRLRTVGQRLIAMGDTMNTLLRPLPCLVGGVLAIVAWSCEAYAFHFLIGRFGIPSSPLISASIFGFATLAGVLSMLPGGVGGFEVVMGLLLTKLGTSVAIATVAIVLFRLCTLWLFSAIGLAFLLGWLTTLTRAVAIPYHRSIMNADLETRAFESATVILPVINETVSLVETINVILASSKDDICEFLIVVCDKTTPESMAVINELQRDAKKKVVVLHQQLPFLGGAMRDAFERAQGSHTIMMASDLETDPVLVPRLIAEARQKPDAIITVSRWIAGGGFYQYSRIKLLANWIFQKIFSLLYATRLSDMTYGYRIFPTRLLAAIKWQELRHPFLFETVIKPLRLGVQVFEIPGVWKARTEGESQNTFTRNFAYFGIGLRTRFAARRDILR